MKRHLTYKDGKSDKFWQIETDRNSFKVTYGKTGSAGVTQIKEFASIEKCEQEAEKLITEKKKKGYRDGPVPTLQQKSEVEYSLEKGKLLVIQSSNEKEALQKLVQLTTNIQEQIIEHPSYKATGDTIELVFKIGNKRLKENTFFDNLPNQKELVALSKQFIKQLIKHNKNYQPIYTHEELETGTFAVEYLVKADLKNLSAYVEFLDSIDLDHTVEQPALVDRLTKIYNEEELSPLINFLRKDGGQLFDDWFRFRKPQEQIPLHQAVQEKRIEKVKNLLEQKNVNLHELDSMNGCSPLHYSNGSIEIARLLIEAGTDINCQNSKGETILHNSLQENGYYDLAFIKYIIGSGGDIKLKDKKGRSAIHHVQTIDGLHLILAQGGKLNDQDNEGNTLLHILASWNFGNELFIETLKHDVNANSVNNEGRNPLFLAVLSANTESAQIFYESGADPDLKDKNGVSARDILNYPFFLKQRS